MEVPQDWPGEDESRGPAASRAWGSGAGPGPRGQRRPEGPRATPHRVPSPAPRHQPTRPHPAASLQRCSAVAQMRPAGSSVHPRSHRLAVV